MASGNFEKIVGNLDPFFEYLIVRFNTKYITLESVARFFDNFRKDFGKVVVEEKMYRDETIEEYIWVSKLYSCDGLLQRFMDRELPQGISLFFYPKSDQEERKDAS